MKIIQKNHKYWIIETTEGVENCGPFNSKKSAKKTFKGIVKFLKESARKIDYGSISDNIK